jgi:myosin heavy subunit
MRLASNIWFYLLLPLLLLNCATLKPDAEELVPTQKAYILIRTEGNEKEINQLTGILNSEFRSNKIASDVFHYPLGMPWNNDQIFSTAYDNNYDYIVLIDQVAKFTIDNKTKVGGKYQIRSYPIKSLNPDWIDLGQKTCNISFKPSVEKFSKQITSQIVINSNSSQVLINDVELSTEKQETRFSDIDYNRLKSSDEMDIEIKELRKQLEIEKEKTKDAFAKKKRLEQEYKEILDSQKKKNQVVLEGLENFKKKQELEEAKKLEEKRVEEEKLTETKKLEEKRLEEERIAEIKRKEETRLIELEKKTQEEKLAEADKLKEKRLEEERLAEAKRKEKIKLEELEKKAEEEKVAEAKVLNEEKQKISASAVKQKNKSIQKERSDKSNALIIIWGSEEDSVDFKKLMDNLEFELLFANIKATSEIYSKEKTLNKSDVLKFNEPNYKYLILIDQMEENLEGNSVYKISIHSGSLGSGWTDLDDQPYNLKDRNSLKQFSKTVLKSL